MILRLLFKIFCVFVCNGVVKKINRNSWFIMGFFEIVCFKNYFIIICKSWLLYLLDNLIL